MDMEDRHSQLVSAVTNRNMANVRRLVEEEGADPTLICGRKHWWPALHVACLMSWMEGVRYFVIDRKVDVETRSYEGGTALHAAACSKEPGSVAVMRFLMMVHEKEGNTEPKDSIGQTPLHYASSRLRLDIIRFLVNEGEADVDVKDVWGDSPLHCAMQAKQQPDLEVIRCLVSRSKSIDYRWNLRKSWERNLAYDIKWLFVETYARCEFGYRADYADKYPLHASLLAPLPTYAAFVELFSSFPTANLSALDHNGHLPIHMALSKFGLLDIVSKTFELEPRAATARYPRSGFYPFEVVAIYASKAFRSPAHRWLDLVYRMFRIDPAHFLSSRGFLGNGCIQLLQDTQPVPKKRKTRHSLS